MNRNIITSEYAFQVAQWILWKMKNIPKLIINYQNITSQYAFQVAQWILWKMIFPYKLIWLDDITSILYFSEEEQPFKSEMAEMKENCLYFYIKTNWKIPSDYFHIIQNCPHLDNFCTEYNKYSGVNFLFLIDLISLIIMNKRFGRELVNPISLEMNENLKNLICFAGLCYSFYNGKIDDPIKTTLYFQNSSDKYKYCFEKCSVLDTFHRSSTQYVHHCRNLDVFGIPVIKKWEIYKNNLDLKFLDLSIKT